MLLESHRHRQPLAVALLDLDLFKSVNDVHGHHAGDRVLAAVGSLLERRTRPGDLRCRWGGEEFLLALPGSIGVVAHAAALDLLRDLCALPLQSDAGEELKVTFSAGIAVCPDDGASVQSLLRSADRRLYAAKSAGRARVVSCDEASSPHGGRPWSSRRV